MSEVLKKGQKFFCPICGLEIEVTKGAAPQDGYIFYCCSERMKEVEDE